MTQQDVFAKLPNVGSPLQAVEMQLTNQSTVTDWYAPYEEHLAQFTDLVTAFEEPFQEVLLHIAEQTKFNYSTSRDYVAGLETIIESLTSWTPNWLIVLNLDAVLGRRLRVDDVKTCVEQYLYAVAADLDLQRQASIELRFEWLSASKTLVWVDFEWEDFS
jgi:hypothetical protein